MRHAQYGIVALVLLGLASLRAEEAEGEPEPDSEVEVEPEPEPEPPPPPVEYTASRDFGETVETWGRTVVFNPGDDGTLVLSGTTGGVVTTNGNGVLSSGTLRIESGVHSLGNDFVINGTTREFDMIGGRLEMPYWFLFHSVSNAYDNTLVVNVSGGTIASAVREGERTTNGAWMIGNDADAKIVMNVTGGEIYAARSDNSWDRDVLGFVVAAAGGSQVDVNISGGKVHSNGRFFVSRKGRGTVTITGGDVRAEDITYLGFNWGSHATMTVKGPNGRYYSRGDLVVGENGYGHLVIEDGGVVEVPNDRWSYIATKGGGWDSSIELKSGGTFITPWIESYAGRSAHVDFRGGRLKKGGDVGNRVGGLTSGGFEFRVFKEGGTIDVGDCDAECGASVVAMDPDAVLRKTGKGKLSLVGTSGYVGKLVVDDGMVVLGAGVRLTELTLGDGAALEIGGVVVDGEPLITFPFDGDPYSTLDRITFPRSHNYSIDIGDDTCTVTAVAPITDWIGGAEGGWWDEANWSDSWPDAAEGRKLLRIGRSAEILLEGSKTFEGIVLENGARVQFTASNCHPTLSVKRISGEGTIALKHAGIVPQIAMTIPPSVTLEIVETASESWLEGDASDKTLTIDADITGKGLLILRDFVTLGGDNSGFEGRVVKSANMNTFKPDPWHWAFREDEGILTFTNPKAGSAKAAWEIPCDVYTTFTEGTLHFGRLALKNRKGWYMADDGTVTISVGALGGESSVYSEYFFGASYWNDPAEVPVTTVEFLGDRFVYGGKGWRRLDVKSGELVLVPSVTFDAAADVFDGRGGKQIDSLVMRRGTTLSGSSGTQKICDLTFEKDTTYRASLVEVRETVPVLDEEGEPVLDEENVPVTENVTRVRSEAVLNVSGPLDLANVWVEVDNWRILPSKEPVAIVTVDEGFAIGGEIRGTPAMNAVLTCNAARTALELRREDGFVLRLR